MSSRHYAASNYDYSYDHDDEFDGYEGDDYDDNDGYDGWDGDDGHTTEVDANTGEPIPIARAVPVKVIPAKATVVTSVTKSPQVAPVVSNVKAFPPLSAPTNGDGKTEDAKDDAADNDNDDGPLMMPVLGRSLSSHVHETEIDSDIIDGPVTGGLSLADFIVTKKRGKSAAAAKIDDGIAAADTPVVMAIPVEGKDHDGKEVKEGGTSGEGDDEEEPAEGGEEAAPVEEGRAAVHVDSLSRFHEFASFSFTSGGKMVRSHVPGSHPSDSGFVTSANELKVADTTREVWLHILQYLEPQSLARSTGVCGFWFHCIGQYDRLWKRLYNQLLPHLGFGASIGGSANVSHASLPPNLVLGTGASYARAWAFAQAAHTAARVIQGQSWSSIVGEDSKRAEMVSDDSDMNNATNHKVKSRMFLASKGLSRARYHLPTEANAGYLSADGKLLATVHRQNQLLPPSRTELFTTVSLYRVEDLQGRDLHRMGYDNTLLNRPWRVIAHPAPMCHEVVVSLELGFVAMRNEFLLSVYMLTGAQRFRPIDPLWSIEMNSRRAVAPKQMFISTQPAGRPSLIICYPGGATIARRLHNGGLITSDVFATPIQPVNVIVPQNTNDEVKMVPLQPVAVATPVTAAAATVAATVAPPVVTATPVTPMVDELQPGGIPSVTATPLPVVTAKPAAVVVAPSSPAVRAVAAPLPHAAIMPGAATGATTIKPQAMKPLPLVPIVRETIDYKQVGKKEHKSPSLSAMPAPSSSVPSSGAPAPAKREGKIVSDVVISDQSSVLALPGRSPAPLNTTSAPTPPYNPYGTPAKKAPIDPEVADAQFHRRLMARQSKRQTGAARAARIEAAKQRQLTPEEEAEKERQRALIQQKLIPTSFALCNGIFVRAVDHQVQVMDLTTARASKTWSPDPVRRNVTWVRAWSKGIVSFHLVTNVFSAEAPHNACLYSRTLDGRRKTLTGLPELGLWPSMVQAWIHPTLGYFFIVFPNIIYVWDLSSPTSTAPMVTLAALRHGYTADVYTSVTCDADRIMASCRLPSTRGYANQYHGGGVVMWRWLSLGRGPTELFSGQSEWLALAPNGVFAAQIAGPTLTHSYRAAGQSWYAAASQYRQDSRYVWVATLFGSPARLRQASTPSDMLTMTDRTLSRWWSDLLARVEVRRAREREQAAAEEAARKREEQRISAAMRKHRISYRQQRESSLDPAVQAGGISLKHARQAQAAAHNAAAASGGSGAAAAK